MRITPNTTINDLYHSDAESESNELVHASWTIRGRAPKKDHKYIKREWVNGRWRYYYDVDSLKNDMKKSIKDKVKTSTDKATTSVLKKTNEASKGLNTIVDKAKAVINKLYEDPKNMYDVNSSSYANKMAKVKESKEWKDIVARKDPEYVKKNEDGTTTYKLDEYLVKKKHPVLDIVSDVISGRKVDINEITKDSAVAGIKDYAIGSIRTGMLAVGAMSTLLTEKFKLQQGSYDDEIASLTTTAKRGAEYVESTVEAASKVSPQDIERMAAAVKKGSMAAEATRAINEGNVIKAAQVIMDSEQLQDIMGSNEYYKMAETTLTNLSDEEVAALNLLLKQMRNK